MIGFAGNQIQKEYKLNLFSTNFKKLFFSFIELLFCTTETRSILDASKFINLLVCNTLG